MNVLYQIRVGRINQISEGTLHYYSWCYCSNMSQISMKKLNINFFFVGPRGNTPETRPKDSHHWICGKYWRAFRTVHGIQSGFGFRNCLPLYDDCVLDKCPFCPKASRILLLLVSFSGCFLKYFHSILLFCYFFMIFSMIESGSFFIIVPEALQCLKN